MKTLMVLIVLILTVTLVQASAPTLRGFTDNFCLDDYIMELKWERTAPRWDKPNTGIRHTIRGGPIPVTSNMIDIYKQLNIGFNLTGTYSNWCGLTLTEKLGSVAPTVAEAGRALPVTRTFSSILHGLGYNQSIKRAVPVRARAGL
jgi:hypothetical protein